VGKSGNVIKCSEHSQCVAHMYDSLVIFLARCAIFYDVIALLSTYIFTRLLVYDAFARCLKKKEKKKK